MAINSYDSIIAALVAGKGQEINFSKTFTTNAIGQGISTWALDNMPPAGGAGTSFVMRACNNLTTGAMSFANPSSSSDDLYLLGWNATSTIDVNGTLILYDRVADVSGISLATTSTQAITSITLPRYPTGAGVQMFLEVTTAITGAPIFTVSYTDQDGNAGAVTGTLTCAANAVSRLAYAGSIFIPLAAGDTGVRAIASLTCSAAGSGGVVNLVLAKPLARMPLITAGLCSERDLATQYPKLPTLPDDHCLSLLSYGGSSSSGTVTGSITAVAG